MSSLLVEIVVVIDRMQGIGIDCLDICFVWRPEFMLRVMFGFRTELIRTSTAPTIVRSANQSHVRCARTWLWPMKGSYSMMSRAGILT